MREKEILRGEIVDDGGRPVTKDERRDRMREYALFAPRFESSFTGC